MQNIILLLICLLAGVLLRRFARVPDNAHMALNGFIIYVALPALVLTQIHGIHLDPALFYSVAMPWLLFIGGVTVFYGLARCLSLTPETAGALMLTGGLGNTSFIGLPMIEAFYGKSGMAVGILIDQLGTYLVLSTLGITVACICSRGTADARTVAFRVVTFPPLIALVLAFALVDEVYPAWLQAVLSRLGDTLAPLALVSVGLQLRVDALRTNRVPLALGLGFKLLAAPALLVLVYFLTVGVYGAEMRITMFESAMGPQIGGAIVASQYGLNPSLVTLMVGVGTILAFATLPVWWAVIALL
jgi:predicted permease